MVRQRCYWASLYQDVEQACRNCKLCRVAKEPTPKVKVKMGHVIANNPLEVLAMDLTMLVMSSSGIENVLVFTDVFTKYVVAVPTRDQTAKTVAIL